jgi:hypothetical protein
MFPAARANLQVKLGPLLCLEPLRKPRYIDDHAFVRAIADFLDFVARSHVEFDAAAIDLGDDGRSGPTKSRQ